MVDKYKVVITDCTYGSNHIEKDVLEGIADLYRSEATTEEALLRDIRDADALLNEAFLMKPRLINALEKCKVIVRYGVGVDNLDLPAATAKRIYIANVPGYGTEEVANHAAALILCCARQLVKYNRDIKEGRWDFKSCAPLFRISLQTLGLVGFGQIARTLAGRMQAFGMRVIAYDPFLDEQVFKEQRVQREASLEAVFAKSDYVSLHLPLSEQTRHLVNEKLLRQMKPTAYLINTARAGLIDEAALAEAVKQKRLAGAGLDLLAELPPPAEGVHKLDEVIITPHCAFYSEESLQQLQRNAAEEVRRVLEGAPPANWVNRWGPPSSK